MAWIHSYTNLEKHHKLIRFRTAMRWSQNEAVGFLHRFWWLVLEVSPSGDITALANPEVMAETLNMKLDVVKAALSGLEEEGFIDRKNGKLIVHDWMEYAGRYLSDSLFRNHKGKLSEIKALHSIIEPSADHPRMIREPYEIEEKEKMREEKITRGEVVKVNSLFEDVWGMYPSRTGKKTALKHFEKTVKTQEDAQKIKTALENYLKCSRVRNGFIQNGSTWFNDWEAWLTPSPEMMEGSRKTNHVQSTPKPTQKPQDLDAMLKIQGLV